MNNEQKDDSGLSSLTDGKPHVSGSLPTESDCENWVDNKCPMFSIDENKEENGYYLTISQLMEFIKYCQGNDH